jgi:hypothetical protein
MNETTNQRAGGMLGRRMEYRVRPGAGSDNSFARKFGMYVPLGSSKTNAAFEPSVS